MPWPHWGHSTPSADHDRAGVAALGEAGAGDERPEAALADNELVLAALGAELARLLRLGPGHLDAAHADFGLGKRALEGAVELAR